MQNASLFDCQVKDSMPGRYRCLGCEKILSRAQWFEHKKRECSKEKQHIREMPVRIVCPECTRQYSTRDAMMIHYSASHRHLVVHECILHSSPELEQLIARLQGLRGTAFTLTSGRSGRKKFVCGTEEQSGRHCTAFVTANRHEHQIHVRYCIDHSHPTPVNFPSNLPHQVVCSSQWGEERTPNGSCQSPDTTLLDLQDIIHQTSQSTSYDPSPPPSHQPLFVDSDLPDDRAAPLSTQDSLLEMLNNFEERPDTDNKKLSFIREMEIKPEPVDSPASTPTPPETNARTDHEETAAKDDNLTNADMSLSSGSRRKRKARDPSDVLTNDAMRFQKMMQLFREDPFNRSLRDVMDKCEQAINNLHSVLDECERTVESSLSDC